MGRLLASGHHNNDDDGGRIPQEVEAELDEVCLYGGGPAVSDSDCEIEEEFEIPANVQSPFELFCRVESGVVTGNNKNDHNNNSIMDKNIDSNYNNSNGNSKNNTDNNKDDQLTNMEKNNKGKKADPCATPTDDSSVEKDFEDFNRVPVIRKDIENICNKVDGNPLEVAAMLGMCGEYIFGL